MINFKLFAALLTLFSIGYSQWPPELVKPIPQEEEVEVPIISLEQINGRSTYETNNYLYLIKEDSTKKLTQSIDYVFYDDFPLSKKRHYLNLDGEFLKKSFPFRFTQLGFDWSPSLSIDKHSTGGIGVGSLRLGPVMKMHYNTLPIRLSGGGALDLWHDSLAQDISKTHISKLNADGGGYVGLKIGNNTHELVKGVPFYASGEVYGNYMSNSNITSGLIDALFIKDIGRNNEISIFVSDTLTKGRMANYTSGNFGTVDYTSSYDRTINNFSGMLGYRRVGSKILRPSILYSLNIGTMHYPYSNKALDEYRDLSNSIALFIDNCKRKIFRYDGWMIFKAVNLDILYKHDLPSSGNTGLNDYKNPNERYDSLVANEDDMEGRYVELFNNFSVNLFSKGELSYSIQLDKYKKIYPNVYTYFDGRQTTRNNRDEINYDHNIFFSWRFNSKVYWDLLFDYKKDMTIYTESEKSAANIINREYRLESSFLYESEKGSIVKENIGILNDQQEFPQYVKDFLKNEFLGGNDFKFRPENSRKLYSRMDLKLVALPWLSLSGSWYETFFDNGYWDIETWKTEYGLGTGNYVVESKSIESEAIGMLTVKPLPTHSYSVGANIKNVINKYYEFDVDLASGEWVQIDPHKYHFDFNPFIEFKVLLRNRFLLKGNIKCNSKFTLSTYKSYDEYKAEMINDNKSDKIVSESKYDPKDNSIENAKIDFWEAGTSLEVYF